MFSEKVRLPVQRLFVIVAAVVLLTAGKSTPLVECANCNRPAAVTRNAYERWFPESVHFETSTWVSVQSSASPCHLISMSPVIDTADVSGV